MNVAGHDTGLPSMACGRIESCTTREPPKQGARLATEPRSRTAGPPRLERKAAP